MLRHEEMNQLQQVLEKQRQYASVCDRIQKQSLSSYEQAFEVKYTHESTALEGNTLTLIETKVVLEDELSIGGKYLREIYEVVNHAKAYRYVKECIRQGYLLNEKMINDIHTQLMSNITKDEGYRNGNIVIVDASHTPPAGNEMYYQNRHFYEELQEKNELNGIELAAWTHAEFVRIHPFADGNGRTSRLLMNYQLLSKGFLPISIAKENRLDYYSTLDRYGAERKLDDFINLVAKLEEKQLDQYLALGMKQSQEPPIQSM